MMLDRIFIIYDVPTPVVKNGSGVYPNKRFQKVIRKMIDAGWAARLGDSFIEILEIEALNPILDALKDVDARYFVLQGEIIDQKIEK